MKVLVTGGAGFIGCNFIYHIMKVHPEWDVTNLDKLTYAGNLNNLKDIEGDRRYHFIRGDIVDTILLEKILSSGFDAVVNFAAESHVDRSILDASAFIETNIRGTQVLLENIGKFNVKKFIQISTDEVYGSIDAGSFDEQSSLSPNSPYSASKAAADLLCHAYWKTYGIPVVITRCTNNFGYYQFPEKLLPLVITNAIENKTVPVYGDGLNVRDWIFVEDHCRAIDAVLQYGKPGQIYNVAGSNEKTNIEIIKSVIKLLGKSENIIEYVSDRPGHDRRYSLDDRKIVKELEWQPAYAFDEALKSTVDWYIRNEKWWRDVKKGDYLKYYERVYSK